MLEEKYYWKNKDGELIPKHELSDYYVCNIVMRFGKEWLMSNGHEVIVEGIDVGMITIADNFTIDIS